VTLVERVLHIVIEELDRLHCRWALVGGLAVSARAEPRFTRDVDVAVAVAEDAEAEAIVHALQGRGFRAVAAIEQEAMARLASVRLVPAHEGDVSVVVDLLFASSGLEPELVAAAERLEILPGLVAPVARVGHLLALKVLARDDLRRPQDIADIRAMLAIASEEELSLAASALELIEQRGFARGKMLVDEWKAILATR
jgi:hypothetical protein